MKNKLYIFKDHLDESLRDPKFRKEWEASELEYQLAVKLIEKRLSKNLSQRQLAKKAKTTQAVISRIESMKANPSIGLIKRIAEVLNSKVYFSFK